MGIDKLPNSSFLTTELMKDAIHFRSLEPDAIFRSYARQVYFLLATDTGLEPVASCVTGRRATLLRQSAIFSVPQSTP